MREEQYVCVSLRDIAMMAARQAREANEAQAIEAQRAETAKTGSVEDESAVGNADAPKE